MRTINLIEGYSTQLSELEVRFCSQRVENLSIGRIAFWNQGADTIDGSQVPAGSPLQVIAKEEIRLLDAKVLQTNHPSGNFSVQLNDGGQGVVLQIVHTGTGPTDIELKGYPKWR